MRIKHTGSHYEGGVAQGVCQEQAPAAPRQPLKNKVENGSALPRKLTADVR